ncbi:MAG: hypothetical protein IPJ30_13100 [Acidobacteria bacterium]|nr:hypothetical protein [Acidobacteriota bacterium]
MNKLRIKVNEAQIEALKTHLCRVYALILEDENIWLEVNGDVIEPQKFEAWSFPPEFPPSAIVKRIQSKQGEVVVTTKYGLMVDPSTESWEYGVYVYCNRRLITADLRSQEVGFVSGQAGIEHNAMNLARIEIAFEGPAELMPWNSRKDALNYNHQTFLAIRDDLIQAVTNTAKWSKALRPDYAEKVQPFSQGEIETTELPLAESIRTRLPNPPKLRKDYKETIISANQTLRREKPWVRGLYEGVIAAEHISRMKTLSQRNRIAWIILDSTVEIALKEYAVYEDQSSIGVEPLKKISREGLHEKVAESVLNADPIWGDCPGATINEIY